MSDSEEVDPRTKELFELLGLSSKAKRQEFIHLASLGSLQLDPEQLVVFRLDSLTSSDDEESDAKLA